MKHYLIVLILCLISTTVFAKISYLQSKSKSSQTNTTVQFGTISGIVSNPTPFQNMQSNEGEASTELLVYPSPCPNFQCHFGIRIVNGELDNVDVQLFDMNGSKIASQKHTLTIGYNKISLSNFLTYHPGTGVFRLVLIKENGDLLDKESFAVITKEAN
jgi:hypothetical protein